MRGRTNITQRAVPYVNGDVIDAEVEYGSVNTGDFVEYKTVTQEQENTTNYNQSWCEKLTQHYKFVLVYTYPNSVRFECYNLSDMSLRCYLTFTTGSTTRGAFDVIDESNIILSIYGIEGSSNSRCYYLTIVNDEFVINQETQILGGSFSVTKISSSRFVIGGNIPSNNHENIIYIYGYNYENKTFEYLTTNKLDNLAIYSSGNYQYGKYLAENLFAYFKCYRFQSSGGNDGVFCYLVRYDPSTGTIETLQSFQLQSTYASNWTKFFDLDEDTIFNISYSSSTNTTGVITIIGYDSANNRMEVKTTLTPSNIWNKAFFIYCMSQFSKYKIVVQTGTVSPSTSIFGLSIFTYNKETEQCSLSDELTISTSNDFRFTFGVFNQNDELIAYYTASSHYYKQHLNYINSNLSKSVDKNYVRQYIGNNAIGFAKTNGNVGDNIKVYVPHQS